MIEWVPAGDSRNKGRLTNTWCKTFQGHLAEMEINWNDAKTIANDGESSSQIVPKGQGGTKSKCFNCNCKYNFKRYFSPLIM